MSVRTAALLMSFLASGAALGLDADPPARVARLSYVEGNVVVQAAEGGAPENAVVNRPLTISDRLITPSGARAEFSIGTAAIRLDEYTDVTIANLDQDIAQIALNSGRLGIHVRELGESETFELDTANGTVRLFAPGDYRLEIDPQGATVLSVRHGDAELDSGGGPLRLRDGERARLGAGDQYAELQQFAMEDSFDAWCIERERAISDEESSRYVSRDVVGYEDLDNYGNWYTEPGYGTVWVPTTYVVGWVPYRFGSWFWFSSWGWTWIDHSPWGFAPFHYGRWAHLHNRWCWVPPPKHHHPVWGPGFVAWNHHAGPGGPRQRPVSWVPLAPNEVFVPSKTVSPRYLRNVNISNTGITNNAYITNVYNNRVRDIRYVNRAVPGAVTTLPRAAFVTPRTPVWTGDFRDNQRLLPGPSRSGNDSHPNRGSGSQTPGTPVALAPTNADRQANERRMTVPRTPTDRRQIESEGNWTRIDTGTRFDGRANSFTRSSQQPAAIGGSTPPPMWYTPPSMPYTPPSMPYTPPAMPYTPPPVRLAPNPSSDSGQRAWSSSRNESTREHRSPPSPRGRASVPVPAAPVRDQHAGTATQPPRAAPSNRGSAPANRGAPSNRGTPSNRGGLVANQP